MWTCWQKLIYLRRVSVRWDSVTTLSDWFCDHDWYHSNVEVSCHSVAACGAMRSVNGSSSTHSCLKPVQIKQVAHNSRKCSKAFGADRWVDYHFHIRPATSLVEGLMLQITVKLSYKSFGFMLNKIQFIKSTTSSKKVLSHSFVTDGTYHCDM